jgi:hypothetical protein
VVCVGFDEHSAEDRERGSLGQKLYRERDRFAEDVAIDLKLHVDTLQCVVCSAFVCSGGLILAQGDKPAIIRLTSP